MPLGNLREITPLNVREQVREGRGGSVLMAENDDIFDDTHSRFDDIRYAPVAINPLIYNKTTPCPM
jgi:hypothetical protein